MTLKELAAGTAEADAMARKILGTLYELAAAAQGADTPALAIEKQNARTAADRSGASPDECRMSTIGDDYLSIAQTGPGRKGVTSWA